MKRRGKLSAGEALFSSLVFFTVSAAVLVCVVPLLNIVALSFSSNSAILNEKVGLWPVEFTTDSYKAIWSDRSMLWSLVFTTGLTLLYTAVAMVLSVFAAYALSKRRLKGRTVLMSLIVFTMYFGGGLIPDYLLVRDLHLLDSIWSLVLPGAVSAFNLILLRSFFLELPESFEESAYMDGANELQVLFKVVLPLSLPVLATVGLFYAVGRWNGFMDALFYINSPWLYPIQLKLYQIIVNSTSLDVQAAEGAGATSMLLPESIKAACVVFATLPIVLVYPLLQKHFIKGTLIGGIKG
jgi:putative aldouronate transport system permease protein